MKLWQSISKETPLKPINLYVPFYHDRNIERRKELEKCFEINIEGGLFKNIEIFLENKISYDFRNANVTNLSNRQTFSSLIEHANKNHTNELIVIANADIYFDKSIDLLHLCDMRNKLFAISRHEIDNNGSVTTIAGPHSQDVWIFQSPLPKFNCNFHFGKPACDNIFAGEARKAGLTVTNPCLSIIAKHLHHSGKRNYSLDDPTQWVHGSVFRPHHEELKI